MNYLFSGSAFASLNESVAVEATVSDTGQAIFADNNYSFSTENFADLTTVDVAEATVSDTGQAIFADNNYSFSGQAFNDLTLVLSTIYRAPATAGFISGG